MQWTDSPTMNDLNVKKRISVGKRNVNKITMGNNMTRQS